MIKSQISALEDRSGFNHQRNIKYCHKRETKENASSRKFSNLARFDEAFGIPSNRQSSFVRLYTGFM